MKVITFLSIFWALFQISLAGKSSKEAKLRNSLLDGYEADAKPDGKINVTVGYQIIHANVCAKKQVHRCTVLWNYQSTL